MDLIMGPGFNAWQEVSIFWDEWGVSLSIVLTYNTNAIFQGRILSTGKTKVLNESQR